VLGFGSGHMIVVKFVKSKLCCFVKYLQITLYIPTSLYTDSLSTPAKFRLPPRISMNFFKNTLKKWRFCHARHETVTPGSSKAIQLFVFKLRRFWHHRDLCSIEQKWRKRAYRHTHTHTQTHTHTDTRTPNFLLLYRVQGPRKRPEKS
jgi:hypothetical protein